MQDSDFEPIDIVDEPVYPLPFHAFTRMGANGSDKDEDWFPIPLEASEGLQVHMAESDIGTETLRAAIWLGNRIIPRPTVAETVKGAGRVIKSRGTGTTTLVAESITNVPITRNVELRAGWWALGGFYPRSAGCIAARAVVPGSRYRPGAIGGDTVADAGHPLFRNFGMGTLQVFYHDNPPTYDFLATSADTAEVVDEDLVYLGEELPPELADAFDVRNIEA